jgi:undecaprenyl-diphosphatase
MRRAEKPLPEDRARPDRCTAHFERGSRVPLRHAVALGLLQGPTELLPISSSGHTTLIPWLADWSYAELDSELRKSFEVALHAGAGVALAVDMRAELVEAARTLDTRHAAVVALSLAPPVLAGLALERPIERRLGGPCSIATGLIAGAVAMALVDVRPGREGEYDRGRRRHEDAGPGDGLALGLAQAAALIPGISRNGATLTVARARGFGRRDAHRLSWHAALPVILGASALKGYRQWRPLDGAGASNPGTCDTERRHEEKGVLAVGAASAFLSTLASARLLRRPLVSGRGLLPYAVYRCMIAAITIARLRRTQNMSG